MNRDAYTWGERLIVVVCLIAIVLYAIGVIR